MHETSKIHLHDIDTYMYNNLIQIVVLTVYKLTNEQIISFFNLQTIVHPKNNLNLNLQTIVHPKNNLNLNTEQLNLTFIFISIRLLSCKQGHTDIINILSINYTHI